MQHLIPCPFIHRGEKGNHRGARRCAQCSAFRGRRYTGTFRAGIHHRCPQMHTDTGHDFRARMIPHSPLLSESLRLCGSAFLSGISCPVSMGIYVYLWLNLARNRYDLPLIGMFLPPRPGMGAGAGGAGSCCPPSPSLSPSLVGCGIFKVGRVPIVVIPKQESSNTT
jgi:hypothetical protein